MYFPDKFDDTEDLNFASNLQRRIEAELMAMIDPAYEEEAARARKATDEYFMLIIKPKDFSNRPDGYVIQQERAFEELCCVLEDNGSTNSRHLTVFEFLNRAAYVERKYKPK